MIPESILRHMKKICIISLFLHFVIESSGQSGCTDPQALNYNPSAVINNGSCNYPSTNLALQLKANLASPTLDESSGIEFIGNSLWTHNDSGNNNILYRVDSTNGSVLQAIVVSNSTNTDWEDITSGPDYLYIGDFGNNNGTRTNLKVYRILKSLLTPATTTVTADIINFSYADQTSFVSAPNNNNYDCEAIIFFNDSLHLFSKNWVDKQTRHYILPPNPGTYSLPVRETFNTGNLITGAGIQEGGVIALIGYDKSGIVPISLWMLYDFHDGLFFNGNKRKFNLSSAIVYGQTEAIDFKNGAYGYISNERFQQTPFNIAPAIRSFDLSPYLPVNFVYPPPVADFVANTDTVCDGGSVVFTDQSILNPISWNWSFPGGTPASATGPNPAVSYNTPGIYDVTLVAGNASGGTDTLTRQNFINVFSRPASTISTGGPASFCTGGSVLLNANPSASLSYQWKKNGLNITGANASSYLATKSGSYRVKVTNVAGCSRVSSALEVTGPPPTGLSADGPLSFCAGDSVILSAASGTGYSYSWKRNGIIIPGATGESHTAKSKGLYKAVITNLSGCSVTTSSKSVTVNCRDGNYPNYPPKGITQVTVFPNPANDYVTINPGINEARLTVYDATGRTYTLPVLYKHNRNMPITELDIRSLLPGLYFIRATLFSGTVSLKFIKI